VVPPAKVFAPLHNMPLAQGRPHKYYSTVWLCLASGPWMKGVDKNLWFLSTPETAIELDWKIF